MTKKHKSAPQDAAPPYEENSGILEIFTSERDVIKREAAIKKSEQHKHAMEHLFQFSEDGIYLLDLNFVIQRTNPAASTIHEITEDLVGQVCYQKIFGRNEPCENCPVVKTLHTKKSAENVYFDNKLQKLLQLRSTPLFDPQTNELAGIFESFRDITDQINFETTVKVRESFIEDMFEGIQDGMFVINRDYTITKTNSAFERMYSEHMPLIGKQCYVTSCRDQICECCPARVVFETGKPHVVIHYEDPTEMKPGMWLEQSAHPIISSSGTVLSAICIIRDITKQKENEDALEQYRDNLEKMVVERTHELEQSEARMRAIIVGGNIPIVQVDLSGKTVSVNAAFQSLTGYSEHEMLGKSLWFLYDKQTKTDSVFLQKRDDIYLGKIDVFRHEVAIRTKSGEMIRGDFSGFTARDTEGHTIQHIFTLLDITEQYNSTVCIPSVFL